jgi:ribosomal protein S18 acetylase RimI-like enzyme
MIESTKEAFARAATPDDAPRICEICSTASLETYRDLLPDAFVERMIREFYNPERVAREIEANPPRWGGYQVVEDAGGRVLGAAGGGITAPGRGELFVIYLDPRERGSGLGTILLDRVTDQLRNGGATEMWVGVIVGNDQAIPFYRARGFEIVETVEAYGSLPGEDVRSHRMRRLLPAA